MPKGVRVRVSLGPPKLENIVKTYPSIPKQIIAGQPAYVFDKLDGSNIRIEWSKKNGFHKFGTRKRLLDPNEDILGTAYQLIEQFDTLPSIFLKNQWQNVTAYFELHGENSFAGNHDPQDDHRLTLIDVNVYKRGFVPPKEFAKLFADVDSARLLYHGNVNQPFVDEVRNGELQGMTFEGVVCKYLHKKLHKMFKVKSRAWLERLKTKCGDDEELFNKLA